MSPDDRYDVSGLSEAQFEPGSDGLVLKNLLGIALGSLYKFKILNETRRE
ncbi:hypothetical protein HZA56_05710 [Candidatus Poribacteria bacterium]|nr:hypothetical protein [Candidatus Poribacteria bacterium]